MNTRLHRVAAVGNSAAVILLILIAASADRLFKYPYLTAPNLFDRLHGAIARESGLVTARRVILVVVDGLRANTAFDAGVMPEMHRLGAGGGRATARVECLVPSSIAGIISLVSGEVPPPASSLSDFGAAARDAGGVFEAVTRAGGRTFVAGPSLWTDLYGRWITASESDPTFGHADERLVVAAQRAIGSDAHDLVVLHLGRLDAVAHRHGARSPEYRAAARWCDGAVGRIARAMGPDAGLVVTSDHGNTDRGGHAGPEPSVLTIPLVTSGRGFPTGLPPGMRQRDIPALLLSALGFDPPHRRNTPGASPEVPLSPIAGVLAAAVLCGLLVWGGLRGALIGKRQATALNLTVWLLLVLIALGRFPVALATGFVVLTWAACSVPGRISVGMAVALGLGVALGAMRLADGLLSLDRTGPAGMITPLVGFAALLGGLSRLPSQNAACAGRTPRTPRYPAPNLGELLMILMGGFISVALGRARLMLVYLSAVATGRALARLLSSGPGETPRAAVAAAIADAPSRTRCVAAGMLTAAALVLLGRASGETISLSTVDVQAAFGLVELPFGLVLAVIAVAVAQSIPAVGLLMGLRSGVARLPCDPATEFAGGLAAALVGQAAVGFLVLNWVQDQSTVALALGLSARVFAEAVYVFLGLAAVVLVSGPRSARGD